MLSLFLLAAAALASRPVKTPTSFPDPLPLKGDFFFVHDPSLVQRPTDGKYFLFTTHDKAGIITADELQGYVHLFSEEKREEYSLQYLDHGRK